MYPIQSQSKSPEDSKTRFFIFLPVLLVTCLIFLLAPLHANGNGATIRPVPIKGSKFLYNADEIQALFDHKKGTMEPLLYWYGASKWPAIREVTPERLKELYGEKWIDISDIHQREKIPLPEKITLSNLIEFIESEQCHSGIVLNATTDKEHGDIYSHEMKHIKDNDRSEYERMPSILLPMDSEAYFPFPRSIEKKEKKVKTAYQSGPLSLQLGPRVMSLHVASKDHSCSRFYQSLNNSGQIIVQTHGSQRFLLMSPDHVQKSPGLFNMNGEFDCSINWFATEAILREEKKLANTTLYSVILTPGDILLIPANWFIYRQNLSTSVSATFRYLPDDELSLSTSSPNRKRKTKVYRKSGSVTP